MYTTPGGERKAVGLLSVLFLKGDAALDLIYLTSCGVENGTENWILIYSAPLQLITSAPIILRLVQLYGLSDKMIITIFDRLQSSTALKKKERKKARYVAVGRGTPL